MVDENVCQQNLIGTSTEPVKELYVAFSKATDPIKIKDDSKNVTADSFSKEKHGTKRPASEISEGIDEQPQSKRTRMGSVLSMPLRLLTAPARLVQARFWHVRHPSLPAKACGNVLGCASGTACKGEAKAELFEDVNDPGQFYCAKCWEDDAQSTA